MPRGYKKRQRKARRVLSKKLGRPLGKKEIAHHINRDKGDNRPRNLWAFKDKYAHENAHRIDGDLNKEKYRGMGK